MKKRNYNNRCNVVQLRHYILSLLPKNGHHIEKRSAGIGFNLRKNENRKGDGF
jgi:hypothetical protein